LVDAITLLEFGALRSNHRCHCLLLSLLLDVRCSFLEIAIWLNHHPVRFYLNLVTVCCSCITYVEATIVRCVDIDSDLRFLGLLMVNLLVHLDFTLELHLSLSKGLFKKGNVNLSLLQIKDESLILYIFLP
jgi:hypothetical protein